MARILVIDDDQMICLMISSFLERKGYEVSVAADGNAGLKSFKESGADLVITDIIMPEKEGIETIRDLREYNSDVKIIAVSGGGRLGPDDYLELARRSGAQICLEKPFENDALLQAVQDLVG